MPQEKCSTQAVRGRGFSFFFFCQFVEQPRIEELLYSVRGQAVNIIARNSNRSSVGEIYEIQVKHLSTVGTWGGQHLTGDCVMH